MSTSTAIRLGLLVRTEQRRDLVAARRLLARTIWAGLTPAERVAHARRHYGFGRRCDDADDGVRS